MTYQKMALPNADLIVGNISIKSLVNKISYQRIVKIYNKKNEIIQLINSGALDGTNVFEHIHDSDKLYTLLDNLDKYINGALVSSLENAEQLFDCFLIRMIRFLYHDIQDIEGQYFYDVQLFGYKVEIYTDDLEITLEKIGYKKPTARRQSMCLLM